MKRIIAIIAALVLVVGTLAACGGDGGSGAAKDVALSNVMAALKEKYDLSGLKVLENASDLNRYYMIDEADVKQFQAAMSTSASQFTEIILIEAVDADAAGRISTKLANHLDTQKNTAKSYTQDAVAMLDKCEVKTTGNFVYLVIADDAAGMVSVIEGMLK